jgi:hypothetical protein
MTPPRAPEHGALQSSRAGICSGEVGTYDDSACEQLPSSRDGVEHVLVPRTVAAAPDVPSGPAQGYDRERERAQRAYLYAKKQVSCVRGMGG